MSEHPVTPAPVRSMIWWVGSEEGEARVIRRGPTFHAWAEEFLEFLRGLFPDRRHFLIPGDQIEAWKAGTWTP